MPAHPINGGPIVQLHILPAYGTPDIGLAEFVGSGRTDAPSDDSLEICRHDESPTRQQSRPRTDLYGSPVFLAVNGMMHVPLELRTGTVGRRRAYGVNMLVLMIVMQAVMPVLMIVMQAVMLMLMIVMRAVMLMLMIVMQAVMPVLMIMMRAVMPVLMTCMVIATRSVVLTHGLRLG